MYHLVVSKIVEISKSIRVMLCRYGTALLRGAYLKVRAVKHYVS